MQGQQQANARRNQFSFFWPALMAIIGTIATALSVAASPFAFNDPLFGLTSETIALAGAATGTLIMVVSALFILKQPNITKGKLSYFMSLFAIGAEVTLGKYLLGSLGLMSLPILASLTAIAIAGLVYAHRETKRIPPFLGNANQPANPTQPDSNQRFDRKNRGSFSSDNNSPHTPERKKNKEGPPSASPSSSRRSSTVSDIDRPSYLTPKRTKQTSRPQIGVGTTKRVGQREKKERKKRKINIGKPNPQPSSAGTNTPTVPPVRQTTPFVWKLIITADGNLRWEKMPPTLPTSYNYSATIKANREQALSPKPPAVPTETPEKSKRTLSTSPTNINSRPTSPLPDSEAIKKAYAQELTEDIVVLDPNSGINSKPDSKLTSAKKMLDKALKEAKQRLFSPIQPTIDTNPTTGTSSSPPPSPPSDNNSHGGREFIGQVVAGEDPESEDEDEDPEVKRIPPMTPAIDEVNPFILAQQDTEHERKKYVDMILVQQIPNTRTSPTPSAPSPVQEDIDEPNINNYLRNLRKPTSSTPPRSTSPAPTPEAPAQQTENLESIEEIKKRVQKNLVDAATTTPEAKGITTKGQLFNYLEKKLTTSNEQESFVSLVESKQKDEAGEGTGQLPAHFKKSLKDQLSALQKSTAARDKFLSNFTTILFTLRDCFTHKVSDRDIQETFNASSVLAIFNNKADVNNLMSEALQHLEGDVVSEEAHPLIYKEIQTIKTALTQIESIKKSVHDLWQTYLKNSMHLDRKSKASEKTVESIATQILEVLKLGATHELILPAFRNEAYSSSFIQQFIPIVIEKAQSVPELAKQLEPIRVALAQEFDARAARERATKKAAIDLIQYSIESLRDPSATSTVMGAAKAAVKSMPWGHARKIADEIIGTLKSGARADEILPAFKVDSLKSTDQVTPNILRCLEHALQRTHHPAVHTEIQTIIKTLDNITSIQQSVYHLSLVPQDPKESKNLDRKSKTPENPVTPIVKKITETLDLGATHELILPIFMNEAYSSRFIQQFISPLEAAKLKEPTLKGEIEKIVSALQKQVGEKYEFEDSTKRSNFILISNSVEGLLQPSSSSTFSSSLSTFWTKTRTGSAPLISDREIVDKIIETLKLGANAQDICAAFKAERCPSDFIQSFMLILQSKKTEQNETMQKKINEIILSLQQSFLQKQASEKYDKKLADIALIRDSIDHIGTSSQKQSDDHKRLTTHTAIVKKIIETLESGASADEIRPVFQAKLQSDIPSKKLIFLNEILKAFAENQSTLDSVKTLKEYLQKQHNDIEGQLKERKEPRSENKLIPAQLILQNLQAFSKQPLTDGLEKVKASRAAQKIINDFIKYKLTADVIWTNITSANPKLSEEHIKFLLQEKFWKEKPKLRLEVTEKINTPTSQYTQSMTQKNTPIVSSSQPMSSTRGIIQTFREGVSNTLDRFKQESVRPYQLDAKQKENQINFINLYLDKFPSYRDQPFNKIPEEVVNALVKYLEDDAELATKTLMNGLWNNKLTPLQAECICNRISPPPTRMPRFLADGDDNDNENESKEMKTKIATTVTNIKTIESLLKNINQLNTTSAPDLETHMISALVVEIKKFNLTDENIANVLIKAHKENVIAYTQLERILLKYCDIDIKEQHKECGAPLTPEQQKYVSLIKLITELGGGHMKHEEQGPPSSNSSSSSTSSSSMADRTFQSF